MSNIEFFYGALHYCILVSYISYKHIDFFFIPNLGKEDSTYGVVSNHKGIFLRFKIRDVLGSFW